MTCKHPPRRQRSWIAPIIYNVPEAGSVIVLVCCDCGKAWERALPKPKTQRKAVTP